MDEEIRKLLNDGSRTQMSEIWEKAKTHDFEGLDDEKQRIAKIMVEHEDELYKQFEHADLTYDPKANPDTGYDPFLHITIHSIVKLSWKTMTPSRSFNFSMPCVIRNTPVMIPSTWWARF